MSNVLFEHEGDEETWQRAFARGFERDGSVTSAMVHADLYLGALRERRPKMAAPKPPSAAKLAKRIRAYLAWNDDLSNHEAPPEEADAILRDLLVVLEKRE